MEDINSIIQQSNIIKNLIVEKIANKKYYEAIRLMQIHKPNLTDFHLEYIENLLTGEFRS